MSKASMTSDLFAGDTHASLSASLVNGVAQKTTVTSGLKCLGLSKRSGLLGLLENVAGHITVGLDEVLADLEAANYSARSFVIPACAVDAPHRRDRVWTVAHSTGERTQRGRSNRQQESFAHARQGLPCAVAQQQDGVSGSLNPPWVEWLMGFPIGHTDLNSSETL